MRIGIDADGTGYDLMSDWLLHWERESGRSHKVDEIVSYNPSRVLGDNGQAMEPEMAQKFFALLEQEGLFLNLKPYPDFLEIIMNLHNSGDEVRMVTKPSGPVSASEKIRAFMRDMPWLKLDRIDLISPKHYLPLDILIDDAPENASAMRLERPGTLMIGLEQPWNNSTKSLWHFLAKDWRQLGRFIQSWKSNIPKAPTPERLAMFNHYFGKEFNG